MITLKEIRKAYEELSGKASEICRQLGYAGIGIIWIFNTNKDGIAIPEQFYLPLILICLSLTLDLAGYVINTVIWYTVYLFNHKKNVSDDDRDIKDSEWINMFTWMIWIVKIGLMVWAYILLAHILFDL